MASENSVHLFVGGGIAGLMGAYLLSERRPDAQIVLVERESEVGGLLRAFDYAEHGRFDYGMHNIYETGIKALDDAVLGLLPSDEWQVSEGNRRDLAGIYFKEKLQTNTPYIDLRALPAQAREKYVAGFFEAASRQQNGHDGKSAAQVAEEKFGAPIAKDFIEPILQKLYRRSGNDLDLLALNLTALGRVVLFDETLTSELMNSEFLRARIGFAEQRRLPERYVPASKTYYPKHYGIHRVIDALVKRLRENDVTIITGGQVDAIGHRGGRIESVSVTIGANRRTFDGIENLYWAAGPQLIAPLLAGRPMPVPFDRAARTVVVNLLVDRPLEVDGLFYFYCYEPGCDTFRLTNYTAYCDGAPRGGQYPVSIEMLMYEQKDKAALERQAQDEIGRFKVLKPGSAITFCNAEVLASGFPMPSKTNMASLSSLRQSVSDQNLGNLHLLGILAEPGLFFQGDILKHVFQTFERVGAA